MKTFTNFSSFMECCCHGITSYFGTRQSRSDSVSSPCRCRVLPILLLCLTLFVGIGNAWATLTADSISSDPVTTLVNGGKYVIRAGTSQSKYLAAKDGTWGSSVAIGSAYVFTITGDKDGFYATCKDGTLTPATSNFSAYGSATSSNLKLNNSGYITNLSSTSYYLQANSSSSYKFRWYSSNQTKARMYQVGNNVFFTQPGSGSISATSTTSTFNSTLNLMPAVYTGKTVTLVASPPSGYEVDAWTIQKKSDNSDVTASVLAGSTLTMPAYDVKVSVTWKSSSPACSNAVGLSKGSATNGTINTISSASVETCSETASDRRVTITITPAACFDAPSTLDWTKSSGTVSASKQSGPTSNGNGTYSYVYQFAQNDNGAGTFGVTCTAKAAGKRVNFDAGPGVSASASETETCDGSGITLPAVNATGVCKGWGTFVGWATEAVNDSNTTSVTTYAAGSNYTPATDNMTLYAVYSKTKGTAESWDLISAENNVTAGTYVITWNNSYYLPSETTAASNPAVGSGITQSNSKLTNTVTTAMQWTFTGDNTNGFTISHVSGNNTYKLSATDAAQGISVTTGSTDRKWKASVDNSYGMLLHGDDGGSRYLAVYNSGSWRYYATGNNYTGTLRLYKKSGGSTTYYCSDPNCCTSLGQINGSFFWTTLFEPVSPYVEPPEAHCD